LSRLMVQSVRQSGLSSVYASLLSFEGDEFYVVPLPSELIGHPFREAWGWIEEAVVVGYLARGADDVKMCPSDDVVLHEGDRLLVLMAHAAVELRPKRGKIPEGDLPEREPVEEVPQRVLVLGHREDLPTIVSEIDRSFPTGSHVTIVSRLPVEECLSRITSVTGELTRVKLEAVEGDITLRRTLERFASAPFDAELLVGETVPGMSDELVDARTLMALLLMRSLEQMGVVSTDRLVSEIRDPRTKELAAIAQVGDFIVSDELVSQLLAQVSESRELGAVWADLVSADGHEVYVKPARLYVGDDEKISFLDVMARARTRGEVAIGWSPDGGKGLALNPPQKRASRKIHEDARIVVIAERDG
jgi:ion channel POLLUX/CASTOR